MTPIARPGRPLPRRPGARRRWLAAPLGCLLLGAGVGAHAQEAFQLGTVLVQGSQRPAAQDTEDVTTMQQIEQFNASTVGAAAALVPGVSMTRNSRNEDMITLRGFDQRQVPLFLDGVPLYVPYDGYPDLGRFWTTDLAEVRVAKGAASLLYGPNALGGAINLVTRKPVKAFEGDVRLGIASGSDRRGAVNVGGRQTMWYWQLGASYIEADTFPLSSDFQGNAVQRPGNRDNAYRTDKKLSLKVALTPNAVDEYAIGYMAQRGEKGNPPYAGTAPGTSTRYWRWPYWDVDSLYFVGNTRLGDKHILKYRLHNDRYKNSILAYTNGSYSTELRNTSFPSQYDDSTTGASVELASYALPRQELRVAYHYKDDRHEETNPLSPDKSFKDVTTSLAAEDSIDLAPDWRLRLGLSHDSRDARHADAYATGRTSANNWLAELSHTVVPGSQVYASLARKSRFPTIKDRYSFRMGTAIPNPDLRPESSLNVELGLRGTPWTGATGHAALFYARIRDLMQNQIVPSTLCGTTICNQLQNIGDARHAGLELSLDQAIGRAWRTGLRYTYLVRTNLSNEAIPLIDTPRNRLFAYVDWAASEAVSLQATIEAESGRRITYGSAGYARLAGYGVIGLKATWRVDKAVQIDVGASNLTDRDYALADGYPMPGRILYANAKYSF